MNEKGDKTQNEVKYEWKPKKCGACNKMGHIAVECSKKVQVKWVPKAKEIPRIPTMKDGNESHISKTPVTRSARKNTQETAVVSTVIHL